MGVIKRIVPILVGICLLAVSQAWAEVRDQAGMFSAQAVQSADAKIAQIQQKTGKTVVVETIPALPPGTTIDQEAHNRFQAQRINGVLVLISNNPKKIAVRVGARTAEVFGAEQRARLRQTFIDHFRRRDFDGGLIAAIDYADGVFSGALNVTRRVQEAPRPSVPSRSPGFSYQPYAPTSSGLSFLKLILLGLVILFVIFLIRGIVGAFQGGGGYYGDKPIYGGGGWGGSGWGGGFLSGLLGGAVGSIIGNSLYNWFSGAHHQHGGGFYDSGYTSPTYDDTAPQEADVWMQDDNIAFGQDVGESSDWGSDISGDVGDSSSIDSGGSDW